MASENSSPSIFHILLSCTSYTVNFRLPFLFSLPFISISLTISLSLSLSDYLSFSLSISVYWMHKWVVSGILFSKSSAHFLCAIHLQSLTRVLQLSLFILLTIRLFSSCLPDAADYAAITFWVPFNLGLQLHLGRQTVWIIWGDESGKPGKGRCWLVKQREKKSLPER